MEMITTMKIDRALGAENYQLVTETWKRKKFKIFIES